MSSCRATNAKSPGDGKIRQDIAVEMSILDGHWAVFKDALSAREGAKAAFASFEDSVRELYALMTKKNHRGQTKAANEATVTSARDAHRLLDRVLTESKSLDFAGHPDIALKLDPMDGDIAEMLQVCRRTMESAAATQAAKGVRA